MSFRELLEKGQIAEFPALQLALGAIKGRVDRLTVASIGTGGSKEDYPLVEIQGTATSYQVKVLEDSSEYLDWLNSALLCAGFVEPIGLTAIARRLAEYEDIILGVDTNILYASILGGAPPRRIPPDPRATVQGERELDPPGHPRRRDEGARERREHEEGQPALARRPPRLSGPPGDHDPERDGGLPGPQRPRRGPDEPGAAPPVAGRPDDRERGLDDPRPVQGVPARHRLPEGRVLPDDG